MQTSTRVPGTPEGAGPPPPPRPLTLYVVSHTHWDREWYLPFQAFRLKLVRLIDKLLTILAADPTYQHFTLDGQTVVLEDYLEVRPEHAAVLREHVRSGRLLVGPWYILPDEFLVSGESLIRNLLRGQRIAAEFGGGMDVGYTPDPFGHTGQLPQILKGFGIDWAVFWRGIGSDVPGTEFFWQAPDGSTVLATRLPNGYSNGLPLSFSLSAARTQIAWIRDVQAPLSTTGALLVLNGDDHMLPSADLPAILETVGAELAAHGVELVHSTLPQYRAAVRSELGAAATWPPPATGAAPALPVHRGEFREAHNAYLLPGVLSTRMWIKQANYAAEILLERWVEPWEALHWALQETLGADDWERALQIDSAAALRGTAWKYLLQNQPHDSICGCSVDAVHDEMKTRFAGIEQVGGELRDEALRGLAGFVNTEAAGSAHGAVLVFNPLSVARTDAVEVTVEVTARLEHFHLRDSDGVEVPYEVVEHHAEQVSSFDLDPLALETALAMAPDGRVMGMAVLDIYLQRTGEAGIFECDITVAEKGAPNLAAIQAAADAARHLVSSGQVQVFRLRGQHPAQVVARFVARQVPGLGYRTYTLSPAAGDHDRSAPAERDTPAAPAAPGDSGATPRPAAIYQPEAAAESDLPEGRPGRSPLHPALVTVVPGAVTGDHVIENEFLRVEIDPATGGLSMIDKQSGVVLRHGNVLVDSGDAGDEYNYCPPLQDLVVEGFERPPRIEVRRDRLGCLIVVEGALVLPAWLSEDRQSRSLARAACPVRSVVRLLDGVGRVDIQTTIDNHAGDHRLRVLFDVPFAATFSDAEGAFDVVRRPVAPLPGSEYWPERAVTTYPQKAFVAVGDGKRGLLLANRGLPEFEVQPNGGGVLIALTLLRCVGCLSRGDLATRPGHAGPGLPTPGGQTLGVQTFEYALVPFVGDWQTSRAYTLAQNFAVPLHALADVSHPGPLPPVATLLACAPAELVLSTLKRSEDGASLILRAWNIAAAPIAARITFPSFIRAAELVRLDETPVADAAEARLHWTSGPPPAAALQVGPREIITLRLAIGRP